LNTGPEQPAMPAGESLARLRTALLPIAGLLLLGAGVALGWFAARGAMPEAGLKGTPSNVDNEAALEKVAEAEQALRLAGFDQAFVYRWRGAALDGYVVVDTPQGTERKPLGPFPKRAEVDPSFRGLLVIAIRPNAAGVAGQECVWAVMAEEKAKEGQLEGQLIVSHGAPESGRLPDLAGGGSGGSTPRQAFWKLRLPGGEARELFKLELVKRER
jgi:hypothetical protein